MNITISIAAGITVAVTGKLIYLLFLSGKTLTRATFFGRLVARIEPARREFSDGWKTQNARYQVIAYLSIIFTMAFVSALLYWLMPALDRTDSFGDKVRFCLLVLSVGVSTSLSVAFALIFLIYYLISVCNGWLGRTPCRTAANPQEDADEVPGAPRKAENEEDFRPPAP